MMDLFQAEALARGDRLAAISVERLPDVKQDFDRLGVDTSAHYNFEPRGDLGFEARSVLVVASPSPQRSVVFHVDGEEKTFLVPPGYVDGDECEVTIGGYLTEAAQKRGHRVKTAFGLPCKAIAAHAGLGVYGRNNVVYVDGMGSFAGLFLYFTDAVCEPERFEPLRWMESCAGCLKCIGNCPTGALSPERDTLDMERCLTLMNEQNGEFPDWLRPEWHNALVGCTRCQYVCPVNQPHMEPPMEFARFDEEQTRAILNGTFPVEELKAMGFGFFSGQLSRNLNALLNGERS